MVNWFFYMKSSQIFNYSLVVTSTWYWYPCCWLASAEPCLRTMEYLVLLMQVWAVDLVVVDQVDLEVEVEEELA